MPNPYARPNIPYNPVILPNNNRYALDAANFQPPTAAELDGDINYLLDTCNALYNLIRGTAAGILPGATNPENVNLFPTTDGNNPATITWTQVLTIHIANGAVTTAKIANGAITNLLLGPGCVQEANILAQSITLASIAANTLTFGQINQAADAGFVTFFNNQTNASLSGAKLANNSIPSTAFADNSLSGAKLLDGSVPATKLAANSVTNGQLAAVVQIPIGATMGYSGPGTVAPAGWLFENGQAVNRVTYAAYFAIVGTIYGNGDGATTFNLRDKRGIVSVGLDMSAAGTNAATNSRVTTATANALTVGGNGGFEQITLDITQTPAHTHSYTTYNTFTSFAGGSPSSVLFGAQTAQTGSTGGGLPHNNMSPFIFEQSIVYVGV